VIDLARAAGGVYTSHIRDEGNFDVGGVAAVDEVIRIAEEAKVTGVVSHMKSLGPDSWGKSAELIRHIEAARRRGVDVCADQYAYEASSAGLGGAVLPGVGSAALRKDMADAAGLERILAAVRGNIARRGGPHAIQIAWAPDTSLAGKRLDEIARDRGVPAERAAVDIMAAGDASIVSFNMSEDDIRAIMRQPWTMTSSDGGLSRPGVGVPHPRNNGAFARKLGVYVRELKVLSLEHAIASMTSLPAKVFGIEDRGAIRIGAFADVTIFDPATIVDRATYRDPHRLATGTRWVIVNGQVEWASGQGTGARAGRMLRRQP